MPTRITGLKGYVAEAVVERWLRSQYPSPEFEVVRQIIPTVVDKRGGGYLDYAVVKEQTVIGVYEVKGQDYIFGKDTGVNKALLRMWETPDEILEFITQDGKTLKGTANSPGFLILLVPPNSDWIEKIGETNLRFVKLFRDIWNDLGTESDVAEIVDWVRQDIAEDIGEVVSVLKKPTQGTSLLARFLELREQAFQS